MWSAMKEGSNDLYSVRVAARTLFSAAKARAAVFRCLRLGARSLLPRQSVHDVGAFKTLEGQVGCVEKSKVAHAVNHCAGCIRNKNLIGSGRRRNPRRLVYDNAKENITCLDHVARVQPDTHPQTRHLRKGGKLAPYFLRRVNRSSALEKADVVPSPNNLIIRPPSASIVSARVWTWALTISAQRLSPSASTKDVLLTMSMNLTVALPLRPTLRAELTRSLTAM